MELIILKYTWDIIIVFTFLFMFFKLIKNELIS